MQKDTIWEDFWLILLQTVHYCMCINMIEHWCLISLCWKNLFKIWSSYLTWLLVWELFLCWKKRKEKLACKLGQMPQNVLWKVKIWMSGQKEFPFKKEFLTPVMKIRNDGNLELYIFPFETWCFILNFVTHYFLLALILKILSNTYFHDFWYYTWVIYLRFYTCTNLLFQVKRRYL